MSDIFFLMFYITVYFSAHSKRTESLAINLNPYPLALPERVDRCRTPNMNKRDGGFWTILKKRRMDLLQDLVVATMMLLKRKKTKNVKTALSADVVSLNMPLCV